MKPKHSGKITIFSNCSVENRFSMVGFCVQARGISVGLLNPLPLPPLWVQSEKLMPCDSGKNTLKLYTRLD